MQIAVSITQVNAVSSWSGTSRTHMLAGPGTRLSTAANAKSKRIKAIRTVLAEGAIIRARNEQNWRSGFELLVIKIMEEPNKARVGLGQAYRSWLYCKGHVTYDWLIKLEGNPMFKAPSTNNVYERPTLMQQAETFEQFLGKTLEEQKLVMDAQKPAESRFTKLSKQRLNTIRTPAPEPVTVKTQKKGYFLSALISLDQSGEDQSPIEKDSQRDSNYQIDQPKKRLPSEYKTVLQDFAMGGFRANKSLNNSGPREPTLKPWQEDDFQNLVMFFGTEKVAQFPRFSGTFQFMKPDFLMRLLYKQLACTSVSEFQGLQIDFIKVQDYHKKLVAQQTASGNEEKIKDGKYVNGKPTKEQRKARRDFWRQDYLATEDQLDKAQRSAIRQMKSLNKSSKPVTLPELFIGSTIEQIQHLEQYQDSLMKEHKQLVKAGVKQTLSEQTQDPLSDDELYLINFVHKNLPPAKFTFLDKLNLFQTYLAEAGHPYQYTFGVEAQRQSHADAGSALVPHDDLLVRYPKKQSTPKKRGVKFQEKTERLLERQNMPRERQLSHQMRTRNPRGQNQTKNSRSSSPNLSKRSSRKQ